ncbi:hypothetical protein ACWEIJ_37870 [Lentzea sp. NPDC004789]
MAADTVYRIVRVAGSVTVLAGAAMFVITAWHNLHEDRGLVNLADWGRPSPNAWVMLCGMGVAAFGLTLRAEPVHGPVRDFVGRLLHLVFYCVVVGSVPGLAEVGARFSAPPDAHIGHATAAEMDAAMLQFAIPVVISGALAYWVSGILPFLTVDLHHKS